jgi:hypothetical protein
VEAGTVTFIVTNAGELTHEFIGYSNPDDLATGDLPVDAEADEADLAEESSGPSATSTELGIRAPLSEADSV